MVLGVLGVMRCLWRVFQDWDTRFVWLKSIFGSLCGLSGDSWKTLPICKGKYDNFKEQTGAILGQDFTLPNNRKWRCIKLLANTILFLICTIKFMAHTDATRASIRSLPKEQSKMLLKIMQILCREPVWWVSFLSCHSEMVPAPILFTLWSFKPKLLLFFPSSLWGLVRSEDHQTGHFASATFAYMMGYVNVISATLKNV